MRTATTHNSKPTIEPEAVAEREAAAFLNLSPRAFRNVMTRGDITPIKIPGVRRQVFSVRELRALLDSWARLRSM